MIDDYFPYIVISNFLSPIILLLIAVLIYKIAKKKKIVTSPEPLREITVKYVAIGAGGTLVLTFIWGFFYELNTGYSAGNAPLGWIFIFGGNSAAIGQLIALTVWCLKIIKK